MDNFVEKLTVEQNQEMNRQYTLYKNGAADVVPETAFKNKLAKAIVTKTPLKIKLGLDPSAPDVHLGHTVVLNKLKQFQDNGHTIQLIIGDFTGKIGDPTGKSTTRKQLTSEEMKHNASTYLEQFGKVLNMDKVEMHFNSKWLSSLTFEDIIKLSASMTVARLLERNDFANRISKGKPISLHEFFYPLMQGYDSVALQSDIELGGTDQHFNVLMGRHLQDYVHQEKQAVLLLPIIEGLDGVEKMSKSKHNYIGVNDSSSDMYGKTMSIPDSLITKYFNLLTNINIDEKLSIVKRLEDHSLHPRDAKMLLAKTLVHMYHGKTAADQAEQSFIDIFQKRHLPQDIPSKLWTGELTISVIELLMALDFFPSKTAARKMIENGGVRLNTVKVIDIHATVTLEEGFIVQVGKRKIVKLDLS